MKMSLNASTLTEDFLQDLIDKGLVTEHTEAAHNFYPRPETGLSREYFIQKNKLLKSYQIGISAFIPGDGVKRQPLYQGLPTLEEHRDVSPIQAYLDIAKNGYIDADDIGDTTINEKTLEKYNYVVKCML